MYFFTWSKILLAFTYEPSTTDLPFFGRMSWTLPEHVYVLTYWLLATCTVRWNLFSCTLHYKCLQSDVAKTSLIIVPLSEQFGLLLSFSTSKKKPCRIQQFAIMKSHWSGSRATPITCSYLPSDKMFCDEDLLKTFVVNEDDWFIYWPFIFYIHLFSWVFSTLLTYTS